jgi:arginase family enzyme
MTGCSCSAATAPPGSARSRASPGATSVSSTSTATPTSTCPPPRSTAHSTGWESPTCSASRERSAELAGIAGPPPLLAPERITFLGLAPVTPPEQAVIDELGLPIVPLDRTIADPAGAARQALEALADRAEVVVHFDVDVLDFLDAPLAENADRAPGLPLSAAAAILEELLLDARTRALTVTEFNPHHGDAATTARLVEALTGALVRPDGRG